MSAAQPKRAIAWFEIPASNFERAVRFYESALDTTLRREDFGVPMAIFNYDEPSAGGSIVQSPTLEPSATGSVIYLNAQPTVNATLERVKRAGGKVEGPAVQLPNDIGWIGFFIDSEGNRIGLHSKTNG
ncbi:VOC family protein [Burkholderia sp. Ac-20365]|uniref:VOC family protein n=1 Tax=Burkholderia sp. Ac-20365 TaxID=2703897 RepID=UPI00197BB689|nr:VOC family protein [Burkholderia sp. Ac-20365]MBN3764945.1 VOC family protein [Burkholderia sp. Ac-20365]